MIIHMPYVTIGRAQYDAWPPNDEQTQTRLENYYRARMLFKGKHYEVYERVQSWLNDQQDKGVVYIVCNFAGLISKVAADMLFGEVPKFIAGDEGSKEQEALNEIVNNNRFSTLNYEMALSGSWRGETIYKIRYGKFADWADKNNRAIIEAVSPGIFWPILEDDNVRGLRGGVFGWVKEMPKAGGGDGAKAGRKYLRLERQLPGRIENELWLLEEDGRTIQEQADLRVFPEYAELKESEETRFPGLLFEFVPNFRLDDEFWGLSDYYDMETVFDELNNRLSRVSRVLDKHESPRLILPPGIMKLDERTGRYYIEKEALEAIEIDKNDTSVGDLPKYMTWDAQLEAAFKQIEMILEIGMMMSETSPDVFGLNKGGLAESGRALKFRLIRTLAKINRKKLYFDSALKNVCYIAQYLEAQWGNGPDPNNIDYRLEWRDGLPDDEYEMAQVEQVRTGNKATTSVESAVRRLDGLEGSDLEDELARIQEDELIGAPPAPEQPVGAAGAAAAGQGNLNLGFGDGGESGDQGAGVQ